MPPPSTEKKDHPRSEFLSGMATREKGVQLAMLIPTGVFLGWIVGAGLDHWLHTQWIGVAGAIFGAVAGFVQMVRLAMRMMK
jgi:F0F1-type ATP synthase assembly protein I